MLLARFIGAILCDTMIMDDQRLTDVSNPITGTCSLEGTGTVAIKTEPVEYDGQVNVWDEIHTETSKEKGPEVVTVKIKTEHMEDGMVCVSDFMGISDPIEMDENGLENVQSEQKTQNEEENKQQNVSVANECVLDKTIDVKKQGQIDPAGINLKTEFDLEENVIVMNKNTCTKLRNSLKPDTSAYSQICPICNKAFRWLHQLKDHISAVHEGNIRYTCKVCRKGFKRSRHLQVHKLVHTEERPHCCKLCPSRFKIKAGLTKHMQTIHGENNRKFKCEHCCKVFKRKGHLVTHFEVHQIRQKIACEICGKKVNHRRLKDHLRTHSGEKNFQCTECGMKFTRRYSLKIHQMKHLDVRPYKCDFCDKSFSCKSRLKTHLKTHLQLHTGDRPHKCQHCEKAFRQLRNLQIHEKRHRKEKVSKCGICGIGVVKHTEDRRYKCELCSYETKTSSDLKIHMRVHTGERPYKCDICPYRAKTISTFWGHKRTHERKTLKAMEAEMAKKFKTDFKLESVTKNNEVMRQKLDKDTDTEVKEKLQEAAQSIMNFIKNADKLANVKGELKDSQPSERTKRTKHAIEKEDINRVRRMPKNGKNKNGQNKTNKKKLEIERKTQKALEAEMKENGIDFKSESVTKNNEVKREKLNKNTDNEVKKKLKEFVQFRMKFKENADKLANVTEKNLVPDTCPISNTLNIKNSNSVTPDIIKCSNCDAVKFLSRRDSESDGDKTVMFNEHMRQAKADTKFGSKNAVFIDDHPERDNRAVWKVKADNFSTSEVDSFIHSGIIVAKTEDFVIFKNESFSPPQHYDNTVAQEIKAENFSISDLDGVLNSDALGAEPEDFVIVKNESFSPPQ